MRPKRIISTIEARMTSTRLPGKVLAPAVGKPMLQLLIERLQQCRTLDGVVVATTTNDSDDPIAELADRLGVGCFRGSEEDVLDRVLNAARSADADVIVEITGDCPLIDPDAVDRLVDYYLAGGYDYVTNRGAADPYPDGLDAQVFPTEVLREVSGLTQDPADREHVSLYIYSHPERYRCGSIGSGLSKDDQDLRLTLDTPQDLQLIRTIFEELYPANPRFRIADIVALLARRPDLVALNRDVRAKPVR